MIEDPRVEALLPGEILVARHTDPGWIAVFANAAGVIAERGSLLSHSAIVAREMGVPCVVSLKGVDAMAENRGYRATGRRRRNRGKDGPGEAGQLRITMAETDIAKRAAFDAIRYAQVWEDADILVAALRPKKGDTVVSIASAGDNALALLAEGPERVIAVDLNPAQLACVRLRIAAYRSHEPYRPAGADGLALVRPAARTCWSRRRRSCRRRTRNSGRPRKDQVVKLRRWAASASSRAISAPSANGCCPSSTTARRSTNCCASASRKSAGRSTTSTGTSGAGG